MRNHLAPSIRWAALAVLVLIAGIYPPGRADTVKLNSGRTVEGNIIIVGGGYVVLERNGVQISLPQSEVIMPDLAKMSADAESALLKNEKAQAEHLARKVLLWDANHQQAKALLARINAIKQEELARAAAEKADRERKIENARNAMLGGSLPLARQMVEAVIKEDAADQPAQNLLKEIEQAEKAAAEKAAAAEAAREKALQEANSALLAQEIGKAINTADTVVAEIPRDPRVQSLIMEMGKSAGTFLSSASTTTLHGANVTQNELNVLIAQANNLAQGGASDMTTATIRGILAGLAGVIDPPKPQPFDGIATGTLSTPFLDAETTPTLEAPIAVPNSAQTAPANAEAPAQPIVPDLSSLAPVNATNAAPAAPPAGPAAPAAGAMETAPPQPPAAATGFPPPVGALDVPAAPASGFPPPPGAIVAPPAEPGAVPPPPVAPNP